VEGVVTKSASKAAVQPNVSGPIHEHESVRVTHDLEAEGYRIATNTPGVVVGIYSDGCAYAVEIMALPGGPEVVTLKAGQIERIR